MITQLELQKCCIVVTAGLPEELYHLVYRQWNVPPKQDVQNLKKSNQNVQRTDHNNHNQRDQTRWTRSKTNGRATSMTPKKMMKMMKHSRQKEAMTKNSLRQTLARHWLTDWLTDWLNYSLSQIFPHHTSCVMWKYLREWIVESVRKFFKAVTNEKYLSHYIILWVSSEWMVLM